MLGGKSDNTFQIEDIGKKIGGISGRSGVITFRGRTGKKEVKEVETRLLNGLRDAGIEPAGEVFLMRYNPPWIPGFLRHNEVGVEIKR